MNPHQKNKVDINSLSADEQRLFRLYGKLPNKKDLLQNKLKERKYFDSGDYALSKAGKASDTGVTTIGTEHPHADSIPHMSPLTHTVSRGDSISLASSSAAGNHLSSPIDNPVLAPSPASMHRGSINGIPGGGLPGAAGRSPVKESSYLARSSSMDQDGNEVNEPEQTMEEKVAQARKNVGLEGSVSPPPAREGIPIRR